MGERRLDMSYRIEALDSVPTCRELTAFSVTRPVPELANCRGPASQTRLRRSIASGRLMSQESVEIVRRFLIVVDVDEALTYADPGIVWNPIEELPTQGHDAVRESLLAGRANGTTTR